MKIIEKFNEYSGIIETGSGYGDVSRVDRDNLIEVLSRLPPGDVLLTVASHQEGSAVLMRSGSNQDKYWLTLCPVVQKRQSHSEEIMLTPNSLFRPKGRA